MKLKIGYKIFIAIMATAVISIIAVQSVQRYNFEQGLLQYSDENFLERLEPLSGLLAESYAEFGSWEFINGDRNITIERLNRAFSRLGFNNRNNNAQFIDRRLIPRSIINEISLLDENLNWVAGARHNNRSSTKAILLDDKVIGYLALTPRGRLTRNLDQRFAAQQNNIRTWASLAIILGALLSAFLIARNLGRPIKDLNEQVQNLSDGKYNTQLPTGRSDEFGSLAKNFNKLANTLRNNQDQRRQWISDIAHELRTPISVLRAEMECIEDGLQPLDLQTISNLKSEVERMNLLINDLHQLTQADAGTLTISPYTNDFIKEITDTLLNYHDQFKQKQLIVTTDLDDLPDVFCDPNRMSQVVTNLIQNTLRYTDAPGKLHISGDIIADKIRLIFEDSAPSVSSEEIDKIFDRLYRVDPSRNRASGSTGLGLSICASIINAHKGAISAHESKLGGLAIWIELPVNQPKDTV